MALRVQIDTEECVSAGKCVADNPHAFGFDDDELAVVLPGAAQMDDAALVTAARRCPSGAIRLFGDGGEPVEV